MQSSVVHVELAKLGEKVSLVTAKRDLSELESVGALRVLGSGRSTSYMVDTAGRLYFDIDAKKYCEHDPDKRFGLKSYNFELFDDMNSELFSDDELNRLETATKIYQSRLTDLSPVLREKELERFVIELSWKSSRIEGNTYSLLDTERLVLSGIPAPGHDKMEARMILNHKEAFKFVKEHASLYRDMTVANIEETHKILVKGMNVNVGLRSKPVGITGSTYRPLDNRHQILEAVKSLSNAVSGLKTPYEKALVALLGIGYIQPFEDGNKRTSRLMANAILLAHHCAPLSYRSIDENDYKEAALVFYEINSIMPFKKIFIDQYDFAAGNYAVR
jgi:Fic family protein